MQQNLAANVTLVNPAVQAFLRAAPTRAQGILMLTQQVELNAMVLAYGYAFRFCAILFALSILSVFLLRKGRAGQGPAPAAAAAIAD